MKLDPTKRAAFLSDLTELTRRYGIEIVGCGCCGSPWITKTDVKDGRYHVGTLSEENDQLSYYKDDNE